MLLVAAVALAAAGQVVLVADQVVLADHYLDVRLALPASHPPAEIPSIHSLYPWRMHQRGTIGLGQMPTAVA